MMLGCIRRRGTALTMYSVIFSARRRYAHVWHRCEGTAEEMVEALSAMRELEMQRPPSPRSTRLRKTAAQIFQFPAREVTKG